MLLLYQFCFYFALFLVVLTAIFGEILDGVGDADLDGLSLGHSWSTRSLLASLLCFGAGGWILSLASPLSTIPIVLLSLLLAFVGGSLIEFGVLRPLRKSQSTSSVSEDDLIGLDAVVIESLSNTQYGKIDILTHGNTLTYAAIGIGDEKIPQESRVIVVSITQGIATVKQKEIQ